MSQADRLVSRTMNTHRKSNREVEEEVEKIIASHSSENDEVAVLEVTVEENMSVPRPELGDADHYIIHNRTAEIAANSPRYRRRSSTFIDGVHDLPDTASPMAPAQLYSTMSGRLFHSGRIAIVLVGPPARGKTCVTLYFPRHTNMLSPY